MPRRGGAVVVQVWHGGSPSLVSFRPSTIGGLDGTSKEPPSREALGAAVKRRVRTRRALASLAACRLSSPPSRNGSRCFTGPAGGVYTCRPIKAPVGGGLDVRRGLPPADRNQAADAAGGQAGQREGSIRARSSARISASALPARRRWAIHCSMSSPSDRPGRLTTRTWAGWSQRSGRRPLLADRDKAADAAGMAGGAGRDVAPVAGLVPLQGAGNHLGGEPRGGGRRGG